MWVLSTEESVKIFLTPVAKSWARTAQTPHSETFAKSTRSPHIGANLLVKLFNGSEQFYKFYSAPFHTMTAQTGAHFSTGISLILLMCCHGNPYDLDTTNSQQFANEGIYTVDLLLNSGVGCMLVLKMATIVSRHS